MPPKQDQRPPRSLNPPASQKFAALPQRLASSKISDGGPLRTKRYKEEKIQKNKDRKKHRNSLVKPGPVFLASIARPGRVLRILNRGRERSGYQLAIMNPLAGSKGDQPDALEPSVPGTIFWFSSVFGGRSLCGFEMFLVADAIWV